MKRLQIYGVVLLFLAVIALIWIVFGGRGQVTATSPRSLFLCVKEPLAVGKFIEPAAVEWKEFVSDPQSGKKADITGLVLNSSANREMLISVVPRKNIAPGTFVLEADLVKPKDPDFLPLVLRPGQRAIAIRVDDVTGGAGLFKPGNYVDVIFARTPSRRVNTRETPAARALIRGVRLLAVNRDLGVEQDEENRGKNEVRSRNNKGTVTLEVSPKGAEILTVARGMGELSLILRSQGEIDNGLDDGVTNAAEVMAGSGKAASVEIRQILGTSEKMHSLQ